MSRITMILMMVLFSWVSWSQNTVVDIIANSPEHQTLTAVLGLSGLDAVLEGEGPFTVFAPTDAAFQALPQDVIDELLSNPEGDLTQILLYHVVGANALSTDLMNGQIIVTVQGQEVTVTINDDGVFINNAQVTLPDLTADNGVVHVIDAVLLPSLQPATVMEIIAGSEDHEVLAFVLGLTGLDEALSGEGPFTVFAPTDAAFQALPQEVLDELLGNPGGELTQILLYHVVGASALSTDLIDGQTIVTLQGQEVVVNIINGTVFINDAQVTIADLEADNGVVHVIDAVLLPAEDSFTVMDIIANSADHEVLTAVLGLTGLDEALRGEGPFTVFAPTDAAFAAIPQEVIDELLANPEGDLTQILLYHVVNDTALSTDLEDGQLIMTLQGQDVVVNIINGTVFINEAQVIVADLIADNGVVHVIDAILLPGEETFTVMDIIANSADHEVLAAILGLTGLDEALRGSGPFTVFAPTDAAFAAIPEEVIDELLANPEGDLTQILLYHVVNDTALSTDLEDGQVIMTLQGQDVVVSIVNGSVFINDAQVIIADLIAENGVVHVIDAVLLPAPATTVMDIIAGSDVHEVLTTVLQLTGLDDALRGDGPFTVFAPTDAAFAAIPQEVIDELLSNPEGVLTQILLYHVVGATALSTDLADGQTIVTLQGQEVVVTINDDGVFINNAQVILADLEADNGVVHVIDAVLLPAPTTTVMDIIAGSDVHEVLTTVLQLTGLDEALRGEGPFTVFAPTDEAFAALPAEVVEELLANPEGELTRILLYHVAGVAALSTDLTDGQTIVTLQGQEVVVTINDDGVFINEAQVILADLVADNGVVHVINAILLPQPEPQTIYGIISNSPDHNILTSILDFFELDEVLDDEEEGPFTVFAPTDAAFEALGNDVIAALLADPFGDLLQIIRHHVVIGAVLSTDLSDGMEVTTANGQTVTVRIVDGNVFIDGAQVIVADLIATNGVVHVIDAILLPELTPCDVFLDAYFTFNTQFGGAPSPDALGNCETFTLGFAVWASEIYVIDNFTEGVEYTFSICNGTGAGSWDAQISVLDSDFNFVATAEDCQITWTAGDNGTYFILINEVGACGPTSENIQVDNGQPSLTCNGRVATVADIIENSPVHTVLTTALNAAELMGTLRGDGPFTVFAPSDDAFTLLPQEIIDALLADPSGALTQVLLYHVVGARALSTDLTDGQMITTLNGQDVEVNITAEGVFINNALVTVADLEADNGVVHVINAVLVPEGVLSTSDLSEAFPGVSVYPNPASSSLFVDLMSVNKPIQRVRMLDVTGRTLGSYIINSERKELNVSNLNTGAYFLEFMIDGNIYFKKVLINR